MRTITPAQLATMLSPTRNYYWRVEVQDSEGAWRDLTNLAGYDWVDEWTFDEPLDRGIIAGEVKLVREIDAESIAPLMTLADLNRDSGDAYAPLLHPGRGFRLSTATVPYGVLPVAGDWRGGVEGHIDQVDWQGSRSHVTLRFSDLANRLVKTFIEESEVRGLAAGTAVEVEMQALIDRWVVNPPTLVTPSSPGWNVTQWKQDYMSVWEAIRRLALQIGRDVRYRWSAAETFDLTFFDPDRTKTVPDLTIGPDEYFEVTELSLADADVRNAWKVTGIDKATGALITSTAEDVGSIAVFGRRYAEAAFGSAENLDTQAELDAFAQYALADTSLPEANHAILSDFLWPLQLGDLIQHSPDGVHYDQPQDYAVVYYRHTGRRDGRIETQLRTRGKPAGAYRRWIALAGGGGTPIASGVPVLNFYGFWGESTADGDQPYGMGHFGLIWGLNLTQLTIHAGRSLTPNQPQPPSDNRHESAILTRPEGTIPQADGWEELWSIRTDPGDWRMGKFLGRNLATGQENITQGAEVQCVDSGTGPTGPPTGTMTVTMNGTTAEIRGLTATDPLAEHLLYRNGRNITRNAPGAGCDFDDPGLTAGAIYSYEVIAFRNGQTSSAPTAPPPQGGGGSGTPAVPSVTGPTWMSGYPLGGVDGGGNPRVAFRWTGDAGYLANVDIEESVGPGGPWNTLLAAQPVNPAVEIEDFTYPNGTDRYFRLKGNPILGTDLVKLSSTKHARYGTSTLP